MLIMSCIKGQLVQVWVVSRQRSHSPTHFEGKEERKGKDPSFGWFALPELPHDRTVLTLRQVYRCPRGSSSHTGAVATAATTSVCFLTFVQRPTHGASIDLDHTADVQFVD